MIKIISILFPIFLGIIGYKMSSKNVKIFGEKFSILKDPIINSFKKVKLFT